MSADIETDFTEFSVEIAGKPYTAAEFLEEAVAGVQYQNHPQDTLIQGTVRHITQTLTNLWGYVEITEQMGINMLTRENHNNLISGVIQILQVKDTFMANCPSFELVIFPEVDIRLQIAENLVAFLENPAEFVANIQKGGPIVGGGKFREPAADKTNDSTDLEA